MLHISSLNRLNETKFVSCVSSVLLPASKGFFDSKLISGTEGTCYRRYMLMFYLVQIPEGDKVPLYFQGVIMLKMKITLARNTSG